VEIDGITIFGYATTIIGNATRFDNPAISNTNSGVLPSSTSPSNTWLRFKGADLSDNIELPFWIYSSKWLRIINPWKDDFICKTNATTDAGNKGLNEVRRGVVCTLTSGSGAKVYVKDVNNGLRLGANLIGTNPDYTADREYTLTESGGTASYTTDGGLLVRVWYNRLGGATPVVNDKMDNRGITQLMKVEYGRQPSFATMPTTGVTDAQLSFSDLPDLGITQATKATVAGYTGISCSYATGTLTATVTSNHTWNEIYDYVKYWESENPSAVWSNSKKSFIETSNKLSYIYNNFVLVINGCTVTAGAGQVLPTSPTVGTSGFFEDASGAIKNNAGTLLYLTPLTNKSIVSLGTSVGIENAVFAYGNEAMGLMTYDTSLNLTRLVANASGVVNGYLEWKRNSIVHANCYSVAGYYGYVGEKVPRSLNGTPIVNEVTRLAVDAQVTKSRTDAGAITGVTFSATGVDMGDNTLADVYDYQQYKFWATTGYIYGTMLGCMEWCVNGKCLEKSGTTYTGRSSSTVYQNMGGGGSFSTGIVEVALADNPEWIFGTMTAKLLNGGDYNYASETFIGTIDFNNASGVAVTVEVPEGVSYTRSGSPLPTIIEPQVYQSVTVSGAVAGSRIQIYDTTHSTQLYEGTPTFPYTWTDSNPYASDRTIRVRVMYKNGATAKIWWENVVGVATLAIDGTLRVNVSTGTMTWQKLYAYETDWLFTSAGIIDEGRFTVAKDVANYLWYDFKIKNVTSPTVPLVVSGGYGVDGDTGASIDMIDTTGGTIIFAPDHVVSSVVTVSGGNVITGDISDITPTINAIKAKTDDIHQVETGRWKIDTATKKMIFYDTDGTTPLKEYDLKDENGNPTSSNPYERVPV
jgi:hypothetical protein